MSKTKRIQWVCRDCATERGANIPPNHLPTWHVDTCDLCGKEKEVTEPRDFGRTRHLLERKKSNL